MSVGTHERDPGPDRRDQSMTLLTTVMQRPLDPGYALVAARRRDGWRPRRRGRAAVLVLAALCGLGTTWSVLELRRPEPDAVAARRSLEAEIRRRAEAADALRAENAGLAEQVAAARQQALSAGGDADLGARVATLARLAGETAESGPGLEVELTGAAEADAARGQVLDRDLQIVVNALWAAQAEAVEVNGNRLTSVSAIRRAGQAVLVDLQPLLPPYRVRALGDPQDLRAGFAAGGGQAYLDVLRRDGIRADVRALATMRMQAATDTLALRYAEPYGPAVTVPGAAR